ncbi:MULTISPECIES: DUF4012 domain-containing protein [unclassified Rhodococcus (in: high G+C Gram-positive bacteria)]|uniref:DUF4012 domain-containing protein n=1 Tax=unclassified Rhodococcus (in: high G+C Gram-positive bacteria) TaxID=192944 RepID=UPI0006F4D2AC|nr:MULTISPECIES: DUF4012 domain-containing protein [unclassified Rhodococcus (in: high G+C Gram-positive bacteria)]KQU39189.1 hypothetical protein ASG69_11970 [Rhodococcus sp. Leaf225]KQU43625.1 hypothetical protein ASH03_13645 [Rhodococcus sp. Leaf258]
MSNELGGTTTARRRRVPIWVWIVAVVLLALVAWFGWTVYTAYKGLSSARDDALAARSAILAGNADEGRERVADATAASTDALDATESPIWKAVAAIPGVGSPLDVVGPLTGLVHDLTTEVLQPAVDVGAVLNPSELRADDGTIDLGALREASPTLEQVSASATALNQRAESIDTDSYLPQVTEAGDSLKAQLDDLSGLLTNTSLASKILPDMLGENSPKSYFLAFQTNAESRGTGGLMGGFAIIDADRGKISLDALAKNSELGALYDPIDLGPDFAKAYGNQYNATANWQNANVSPHFPYTGEILRSIWQQESGQSVDGVLATDPVALSYILGVVGPVTLADGEQVTSDNVVNLTQSEAYFRFADDNLARKDYLQQIAARVFSKVEGKINDPAGLLDAIGRGVSEGHTAVWSADPAIQSVLSGTKIAHEVPDDPAPYAALVVNNGAGGKLDYYLERDITYTATSCEGDTRTTQITASVTNTAPPQEYPTYIAGRQNETTAYEGPPGTNRSVVSVFTTTGSTLTKASIDGQQVFVLTGQERGHPFFYTPFVVEPGQTKTLVLDLVEPTAPGAARVPLQPATLPGTATVDVPDCSGS